MLVPTGVLVGWLCARIGVTPNQVTHLSLGCAALGVTLVATGRPAAARTGLILLNLWQLLDCVDGAMPRATAQTSRYGAFIDTLGGYVVYIALPLAVGIGLFLRPETSLELFLHRFGWGADPALLALIPLAFGVLASWAVMLRSMSGFLSLAQSRKNVDSTP